MSTRFTTPKMRNALAAGSALVLGLALALFLAAAPRPAHAASLTGGVAAQEEVGEYPLQLQGAPTVYVQSGGEIAFSLRVKNVSGADLKGVYPIGFSEQTSLDPMHGYEDTWDRFEFLEDDSHPVGGAVWDDDEEGYTIAAGAEATFWFEARSRYEQPNSYADWVTFGDVHTEYLYGFIPYREVDADYSGKCPVEVVTYDPDNAAITMGTSTNAGHDITTVPLGTAIDFGTVNLGTDAGLTAVKTFYIRNTSPTGADEHGNSPNIKVDFSMKAGGADGGLADYPIGFDSYVLHGGSWAPLSPAPLGADSFESAMVGITLDAADFVAGDYSAELTLATTPHGVKVNGGTRAYAPETYGTYTWPVTVRLTGNNARIPAAPTQLAATPGNGQVQLTWKAAAGSESNAEYHVYRRDGGEPESGAANLANAQFDWQEYELIGSDLPDDEGGYLFVDGTAENGKTYTYVVIGGAPLQAYPAISQAVQPQASLPSKLLAPYLGGGSSQLGGVLLDWWMNDAYDGQNNDGSSMVDHFNVYRDGVLVAQVSQSAVISEPRYLGDEVADMSHTWQAFVETPVPNQDYSFNVAAVSASGVEGYWSETNSGAGMSEDVVIKGHTALYWLNYNGGFVATPTVDISLDIASAYGAERIDYWRAEGTAVPDTAQAPHHTISRPGYSVESNFSDVVAAGKTYTYVARADDGEGHVSEDYVFRVKAATIGDAEQLTYTNSARANSVTWQIVDGKRVHLTWNADLDPVNYRPMGTYRVYRDGQLKRTFTANASSGSQLSFDDDPGADGAYLYRLDKEINGLVIEGPTYTFDRNTAPVDESALLKPPSAPVLSARVSDGVPVLRWAATSDGGEVAGFHVYRRDAGSLVNGHRAYAPNAWTSPYDKYWDNMRYLSIDDPSITVFADTGWYFQDDEAKGSLTSVSWGEDQCPHEYWVTAYNAAGESAPSQVQRFEFQGLGDDEQPIAPVSEDDHAPGAPTISKLWVEWDDQSDSSMDWATYANGYVHVAWDDATAGIGAIDRWDISFSGLTYGSDVKTLHAWQVAQDAGLTQGFGDRAPTSLVSSGSGSSGDYGRSVRVTVSAANTAGSTASAEETLVIRSFPRFRALPDNGSVLLQWTDLLQDPDTAVDSWEVWRAGPLGDWVRLTTLAAADLDYAKDADGAYEVDGNGTRHHEWRDSDVDNGRSYQYKVIACCGADYERPSVVRTATPSRSATTAVPSAPQNLRVRLVNGEVLLSWDPPATGDAQYYRVMYEYQYPNDDEPSWWRGPEVYGPSTSAVWSQISPGRYRFLVYAYSKINGQTVPAIPESNGPDFASTCPTASNISDYLEITEEDEQEQADDRPGGFTLTANASDRGVELTWTESTGATFYTLERFKRVGDTFEADDAFAELTLPYTTTEYIDDSTLPGVRYLYTAYAHNIWGGTYAETYVRAPGKTLEEIAAEIVDRAAAAEVDAAIGELPPVDAAAPGQALSLEDRTAVEAVRAKYRALTAAQRAYVTRLGELVAAENRIAALQKEADDSAAAADVLALIGQIDDPVTLESEAKIAQARTAYGLLSPEAQQKVRESGDLAKLEAAESQLSALKDAARIDISGGEVTVSPASFTYSGAELRPAVTLAIGGVALTQDEDYTVAYADNVAAGTGFVTINGINGYKGQIVRPYSIGKAANPLSAAAKAKKVKYKKVKKKKQTVAPITVRGAQGAVSYKVVGGNKKAKKALKVNTKTGKITVKKKTKKGTYKVKVQVTAAGNQNYSPASKIVTVTVKVR